MDRREILVGAAAVGAMSLAGKASANARLADERLPPACDWLITSVEYDHRVRMNGAWPASAKATFEHRSTRRVQVGRYYSETSIAELGRRMKLQMTPELDDLNRRSLMKEQGLIGDYEITSAKADEVAVTFKQPIPALVLSKL